MHAACEPHRPEDPRTREAFARALRKRVSGERFVISSRRFRFVSGLLRFALDLVDLRDERPFFDGTSSA